MSLKRRQFTRDFKLQVLHEIEAGKSVAQAAREYQLHPHLINYWQKVHAQYAERAFAGQGQIYKEEARIAELERMIGQLTMENALLKKVLARLEARLESQRRNGGKS
jgi:transposase